MRGTAEDIALAKKFWEIWTGQGNLRVTYSITEMDDAKPTGTNTSP